MFCFYLFFIFLFSLFASGLFVFYFGGLYVWGVVGESIMQFVRLFSSSFTAEFVLKAKETNHLCFCFFFVTLHSVYL